MKPLYMKYLSILLVAVAFCMTACNHNNEPPTEVNLPIREQFIPVSLTFDMSDTESKELTRPWWNKDVVVNSVAEIPNDPFGFPESYHKINFTDNTLLLCYQINDYIVVSYFNRYYKNTVENTYNWSLDLGISGSLNEDDHMEKVTLSRFAILVPKIPSDAKVAVWHSITSKDFDWDK